MARDRVEKDQTECVRERERERDRETETDREKDSQSDGKKGDVLIQRGV